MGIVPSKKPIIPSGMNCLYCCQFCIVIDVPGGIESAPEAAPSSAAAGVADEAGAATDGAVVAD